LRELCMPMGLNDADMKRLDDLVATRRKIKRGSALWRNLQCPVRHPHRVFQDLCDHGRWARSSHGVSNGRGDHRLGRHRE
jgi:hypothetical protein